MDTALNKIYRTIWSEALGAWVAVSELVRAKGKRSGASLMRVLPIGGVDAATDDIHRHRLKLTALAALCLMSLGAQANPMGGQVVSGSASFNTSGNTLTVTNTPGAIIHWQDFSIQQNEITRFAQQSASSAVLNRVVGGNTSQILGSLQSNGRVFLVNPSGIVFGQGATVDVAGLVATSLNLSDADFLAGRHRFSNDPNAQAVRNAGNINAQQGGEIWLIAPDVENSGVISAPDGEILLAAGASVELTNSLDPNLRVNITAPAGDATNVGQLVASAGRLGLFGTLVRNSGSVSADSATMQGGKIVFRSSQRTEISGTASATGVGGGEIKVLSDMGQGTVSVSGTLDASAPQQGDGGFIDTSAAHLDIASTVSIRANAANGRSGEWLIDPLNVTIGATGSTTGIAQTSPGGVWTPSAPGSYINTGVIQAALNAGTNVTVTTTNAGFAEAGNITVSGAITMTGATPVSLTLQADNSIALNANISSTNATPTALNLVLDHGAAGSATLNATLALAGGSVDVRTAGVTGAGTLNVTGGATSLTGNLIASTLNLSNGTLDLNNAGATGLNGMSMTGGALGGISNVVLGAGSTFNWTGGTINGHLTTQGTTTVSSGSFTLGAGAIWDNSGAVAITSGGWGYIGNAAILNNSGTFDIGGNFGLQFTGAGGQFNNLAGGTVVLSGVYGSPFYNGGINGTFSNAGTLNKTSTSTQTFHVLNSGTINITTGTVGLIGTWSSAGGTINFSAGTLQLNGNLTASALGTALGTFNRTGGSVQWLGTLDNTAGMLDIGGAGIFGAGGLTMLSGTILGGTLVNTDATPVLASSSGMLDGVTIGSNLTQTGTLNLNNTVLALGSSMTWGGGTITGTLDTQGDMVIPAGGFTVATGATWNNSGIVTISSGSWGYLNANAIWNNSGVVDIGGNFGVNFNGVSGAQLNNLIGGTVNLSGYYSAPITGAGGTFNNAGILTQTSTSTQSVNNLLNTGSVDITVGTLNLLGAWTNAAGTINLSGGTLGLGGAFTPATLGISIGNLVRTGGTVSLTGVLDNTANVLDVGSAGLFGAGGLGSFTGTILGGTVVSSDAMPALTSNYGTLDGVVLGDATHLSLAVNGNTYINNGLTIVNGATVSKDASTWYFGTTGLQHIAIAGGTGTATLNLAGGAIYAGYTPGGSLQIDTGVTVQGYGSFYDYYTSSLTNNGILVANTNGQTLSFNNSTTANNGTMNVTAGTLSLNGTTFANSAAAILNVGGGTLNISPNGAAAPNWSNSGLINVGSGTLNLGGTFTVADLNGVTRFTRSGGTVNLSGKLDNAANVLDVGSAGLFGTGGLNSLAGTILGGTVISSDVTPLLSSNYGTLDGVVLGDATHLSLVVNGNTYISNGLAMADGASISKDASTWYFGTTGLQHIGIAGGTGTATLTMTGGGIYAGYTPGGSLQIDAGMTVQGYGSFYDYYTSSLINNGTLIGNTAGQGLYLYNATTTNNGTMNVTAGTLNIFGANVMNSLGATIDVAAGSVLDLRPSATFTNDGTLTLGGATHTIGSTNTAWSNTGSIAINSGILNLGGLLSSAELNPLNYSRQAGTTVNLAGTYTNTGLTLDLGSAGLFGPGGLSSLTGTILGGTVISSDATPLLISNYGTLDGVVLGDATHLSLTVNGNLYLYNGLTMMVGASISKDASTWYFGTTGLQHIGIAGGTGNATLNLTNGTMYAGYTPGGSLQIDTGVTVQGYGGFWDYYTSSLTNNGTLVGNTAGQTLGFYNSATTNNGTMNVTAGTLSVYGQSFTNSLGAVVSAGGGSILNLQPSTNFTNGGTITLGGATATLGNTNTVWVNTGNIAFNAGTLNLGGQLNAALFSPANYTRMAGTTLNVTGTYSNTGQTLDVGSAGIFGAGGLGALSGTILGGTVISSDATPLLTSSTGTLDSVVLGDATHLSLTVNGSVIINNGLTIANGATVSKDASTWYFGTTGLQHIGIAGGTGTATLSMAGGAVYAGYAVGGTLQVDTGVTVQGYGGFWDYYTSSLINNGILISNTAGQTFSINTSTATNNGTLNVSAGTLNVTSTTFTTSATSDIRIGNGAIFTRTAGFSNAGTLRGDGTLNLGTATLTNIGAIDPGAGGAGSFGMLKVTGNLDNTAGTLNMEIGGLVPGVQHDRVYVSGTFTRGGTLSVSNTAYTPGGTDSFNLFQTGTLAGTFTTVNAGTYTLLANTNTVYVSTNGAALPSTINAWWLDGSGNWATLANWTNQAVPVATDDVVINRAAGAYTITVSGTHSAATLVSAENLDLFSTLTVSGAAVLNGLNTLSGTVNFSGGLTSNGTIAGNGTINVGTSTLQNNGALQPGAAGTVATLNITGGGSLVLSGTSVLDLDLGGTGAGQSDRIAITGNVTMGGSVNANIIGGYTPVTGDTIPFLTMTGTSSGTFATLPVNFSAGYSLAAGEAARLVYGGPGNVVFTNAAGGLDWSLAGNWSSGTLPGSTETVVLSSGFSVVYATGTDSIAALIINSGNALDVSGGSLSVSGATTLDGGLTVSGGALSLGGDVSGAGAMSISAGTLNAPANMQVASLMQSGGTFNAPGSFMLDASGNVTLGNIASPGLVLFIAGGTLSTTGTITASGATLQGANYVNSAATPFNVSGTWRVYSTDPANDTLGSLAVSAHRYNCTRLSGCLTPGTSMPTSGLFYSIAPVLTVGAANQSRLYGQPDSVLAYTATAGFVGGDGAATTGLLAGSLAHSGANDVGSYAITQGTLYSPLGYGVSFTGGATVTITPALLNVFANSTSKYEGNPDPALTYWVSGLQYGETAAGVLSGGLARDAGETVGNYPITIGTLALSSGNYTLNFTGAALAILTPPVTAPSTVNEIVETVVASVEVNPLPVTGPAEESATQEEEQRKKADDTAPQNGAVAEETPALDQLPVCR